MFFRAYKIQQEWRKLGLQWFICWHNITFEQNKNKYNFICYCNFWEAITGTWNKKEHIWRLSFKKKSTCFYTFEKSKLQTFIFDIFTTISSVRHYPSIENKIRHYNNIKYLSHKKTLLSLSKTRSNLHLKIPTHFRFIIALYTFQANY